MASEAQCRKDIVSKVKGKPGELTVQNLVMIISGIYDKVGLGTVRHRIYDAVTKGLITEDADGKLWPQEKTSPK